MSDDRGAAGHLEHRSVVGIVGLRRDPFFYSRLGALARESIGRAVLETKREIVVGDHGGLVLGRELAITAGMIAVEMGIDDVFYRLAAACLIDGRLDLIVQRRKFGIHLDYRIITASGDDIPALTFQHEGAIAEVGSLDLNFREVLPLRKGCGREQGGYAGDGESKPHANLLLETLNCLLCGGIIRRLCLVKYSRSVGVMQRPYT